MEEVEVGVPGPGEVLLRHTAIGLNFIDTYNRSGLYPIPSLPAILGREGAGVVAKTGAGVTDLKVGDRVAYAGELGAYCESRTISADALVPLPDDITDVQAAAMMIKGLTVWYLLHRTHAVQPGETILIHAAAGGVGLIACQWARHIGATVIGTVGTDEKAELAAAHGCHHPVVYTREDFVERVRELTGGKGVPVVYDSVGRDTFERSLDCLSPLGMMVTFGQSSGPVQPINVLDLSLHGSLFLTRPTLFHYVEKREELLAAAEALFKIVRSGAVKIEVWKSYPLKDVAHAHADLEGRRTTGSVVLIP